MKLQFDEGEIVCISCVPTRARVSRTTGRYVFVEWPWRSVDPDSRFRWDGTVAFPVDPESTEWDNMPWRITPRPSELSAGQPCVVEIPAMDVIVERICRYDPPRDTGWTPRPALDIVVRPVETVHDEGSFLLYINAAEPISVELPPGEEGQDEV